ncbi:MAG TPA: hypothetical protein VKB78_00320, partial [Pirellulales bacterium]|nr:hypothetical protein [Pirellulales bacterium]
MISSRESAEWLVANLGKHLELGSVLEQEYVHSLIYELPADTGKKTALARVLTQYLVTPQAGLLWFT